MIFSDASRALPPATGRLPGPVLRLLAALGTLVAGYCVLLWGEWRANPDLSHGFFAPVIFLLLLRESRRQGTRRWLAPGPAPAAAALLALLAGVGLFGLAGIFAASLGWTHAVVCVLLAGTLGGFLFSGLLVLADERVRVLPFNWVSLTAIFLWLLVAPLPDGTYARVTLSLQGWVTGGVLETLHFLGIPARQHGNIIELASTSVGVEEACSGIRSLISCLYAGCFFAAWQVRRPAGRAVLIVAAPLLALGMNFLRSLTLTLLANRGTDIMGFWHDATGFAILGVTALLLAGLAILLESRPATLPVAAASAAAVEQSPPALRFFWAGSVAFAGLAAFYAFSLRPAADAGRPTPDLAAMLPAAPAGWEVRTPADLYQFADILQTSHLMERTYLRRAADGGLLQFTVYVAYWPPGRASVSRVASHTPDACWPGSGWTAQPTPVPTEAPALAGLKIAPGEHRLFINGAGFPQHVWFWHVHDGRVITYRDPYSIPALFQIALQYGFRRQGDQFFVRVSSNRPWPELADEPLVREIFVNLSRIGL
ncbi:MAG: exosortase/archaeosortase family protein [Opitutaceae bacterium]|nr:exosortase/archaeosortase family protein [Opitutaceae bacterium]